MRRLAMVAAAAVCALAAPAAARAETFTVNGTTGNNATCSAVAGHPCKTIAKAIALAHGTATQADVIRVSAGAYPETIAIDDSISVIGAGNCTSFTRCTTIDPPSGAYTDPVNLQDAGAVSHLHVDVFTNASFATRFGVDVSGDHNVVDDVTVNMANANNSYSAFAGYASGTTPAVLRHVSNAGPGGSEALNPDGSGLDNLLRVEDSTLVGHNAPAVDADHGDQVTLARSRLSRTGSGGTPTVEMEDHSSLVVDSSLVIGAPSIYSIGSGSTVVRNSDLDGGSAVSTVLSSTTGPTSVIDSILNGGVSAGPAPGKATCRNSILPTQGQTATVDCASGASTGNLSQSLASVWVDRAGGDYRLKPGTAAVDSTRTALAAGQSATDLAGAARTVDGNCDGRAVRDRGAYELTGYGPPPAPSVAVPGTVTANRAARFGVSAGGGALDSVAIDGRAIAPAVSVVHTFTTTGTHSITVRAHRGACSRTATAGVRVIAPSAARDRTKPRLRRLKLKHGKLSFRLSERGSYRLTLYKRKHGRYRKMGSAKGKLRKSGKVSIKLSRKLRRRYRKPGRYLIKLAVTDGSRNRSKTAKLKFRVR